MFSRATLTTEARAEELLGLRKNGTDASITRKMSKPKESNTSRFTCMYALRNGRDRRRNEDGRKRDSSVPSSPLPSVLRC